MKTVRGNIVDVVGKTIYSGELRIVDGVIKSVERISDDASLPYVLPGFCDAHVHIESSMLLPTAFAMEAVKHGTVATVSDPHEIANVCGVDGVTYMLENAKRTNFYFNFGAPSCVPATSFETAGATIDSVAIDKLLSMPEIGYLSEMMNYPGVLNSDEEVMKKIAAAKKHNKPVDGHAPGLVGDAAVRYIEAGISTDHECFTYEEGLHKVKHGMKILIREGSSARNFEALWPLIDEFPDSVMLCTDDTHPDDLIKGHINLLVKRALAKGCELFNVLRAVSLNPKQHYRLKFGLLQPDDSADFVVVDDLQRFNVLETYIGGEKVAERGVSYLRHETTEPINNFNATAKTPADFRVPHGNDIRIIQAIDGQLITESFDFHFASETVPLNNALVANDVLKIVVVNRYSDAPPAIAFINGFGLKRGAIASSVAHDSHNVIAVGTDDESICEAVNAVIRHKGGLAVCDGANTESLPLPVAGLMSLDDAKTVGEKYEVLDRQAKALGCTLRAPFMTLSFMALLVIPKLKLSDKGLFDAVSFRFTPVDAAAAVG